MNFLKKIVSKCTIVFFGQYSLSGFYKQQPQKKTIDNYVFSSIFPDEDTMEQVLNAIK